MRIRFTWLLLISLSVLVQAQNSVILEGDLNTTGIYRFGDEPSGLLGGRYLPGLKVNIPTSDNHQFEFEVSGNLSYAHFFQDATESPPANYSLQPYRALLAYSGKNWEIRTGLQTISFGSAVLLRPLMWFETLDPRDPMRLAEGVWGGLGRYYFSNNINLWAWVLYGNRSLKGWEQVTSDYKIPEWGGRVQIPLPLGEAALAYHNRSLLPAEGVLANQTKEHRVGFDAKVDALLGLWVEYSGSAVPQASWMNKHWMNLGADYTFPFGNGLGLMMEQLSLNYRRTPETPSEWSSFSLLSLQYKINWFAQIQSMVYYDWTLQNWYQFWNFSYQYKSTNWFLLLYFNPDVPFVPGNRPDEVSFAGNGIQLMMIYKHRSQKDFKNRRLKELIPFLL